MTDSLTKICPVCGRAFTRPSRMTRSDWNRLVTCQEAGCLSKVKSDNGRLGGIASRAKSREIAPAPREDRTWRPLREYMWQEPKIRYLFVEERPCTLRAANDRLKMAIDGEGL